MARRVRRQVPGIHLTSKALHICTLVEAQGRQTRAQSTCSFPGKDVCIYSGAESLPTRAAVKITRKAQ